MNSDQVLLPLTYGAVLEMINYMADEEEQIENLNLEQIFKLQSFLMDAVTDVISEFTQELRDSRVFS